MMEYEGLTYNTYEYVGLTTYIEWSPVVITDLKLNSPREGLRKRWINRVKEKYLVRKRTRKVLIKYIATGTRRAIALMKEESTAFF